MPAAVQNGNHTDDVVRTKILLLGLRRSGKTSITQVIFEDLPPKQAFYLERTTRITKHTFDTVIPLEIWDCPGDISLEMLGASLSQFASLIFVIDIQDLLQQPVARLVDFVVAAYHENQNLNLEVFVHKADVLSDEYKLDNFREIQQRVIDELLYISPDYEQMPMNFYLTSIYDHSLHDAFSRVLHKSIESLPYLEDLLNVFCANSQSSKAFLFDIRSRLYVATDASPVDPPTHNLCNDYLQMLNAFGPLYKSVSASPARHRIPSPPSTGHSPASSSPSSPRAAPRQYPASNGASTSSSASALLPASSLFTSSASASQPSSHAPSIRRHTKPLFYPSASTSLSPSSAGAGTTLTYHLITPQLGLLALIPTTVFEMRHGLVEYNVVFFREGVQEICEVEEDVRKVGDR
ncbi:GTP-binding protein [Sparassis crispa]|uniref:GTP-binding protein n=1 Tax=Sparassis crispa TaxID=139825 RepID=A0A401H1J8_9APHY|nr:GTP-binding protein [Sparassis crispa]GBE88273.1 GTP-binding protein [Sparassis crispa]